MSPPRLRHLPTSQDATWLPVDQLRLDEKNPRLLGEGTGEPQDEILETLWREFAVDEVALSIAANGFFPYEPLFAVKEKGHWVVVEGNRRLAAVRLLRDDGLRARIKATNLPALTSVEKAKLDTLPVVPCEREQIWEFLGFKHVNGAAPWDSMSKAEYIAWVHNSLNITLADIARRIGDRHATVARLYTGLMALNQVEGAGEWHRDDRWNKRFYFSHLYTGLTLEGIRSFVGMSASKRDPSDKPVPKSHLRQLGELCVWLYGSKQSDRQPLIASQNPDLGNLSEVLATKRGVAALRQRLPLSVSLEISRGDERILRETLVNAKSSLQDALGRVPTGYGGEDDVRRDADDILSLADSIVSAMDRADSNRRRGRTPSRTR